MLIFWGISLNAQQNPAARQSDRAMQQYRLAQTYQQLGDHEMAARILENLHRQQPQNLLFYEALLESYLFLSRLDKAEKLIEQQRALHPGNVRFDIDRGLVLYKKGQQEAALQLWQSILQKRKNDVTVYTMIANAMWQNRLYDEALDVYKAAYRQFPGRTYLLQNIANLYRMRMQYRQALIYYLEYLKREPDRYRGIIRQILTFRLTDEQADSLIQFLKNEARLDTDSPQIKLLIAKFYQKYQHYEDALKMYLEIQGNKDTYGYLLDFARAAQNDSAFAEALKAYEAFIARFPHSPDILRAYQGAAYCHLALARMNNDVHHARQALNIIQTVRDRHSNQNQIARLRMLEADIYKTFFFDIDRALQIYRELFQAFPKRPDIAETARIRAAECYLIRGELDAARQVLKPIRTRQRKPEALYLMARIAFYQQKYDQVKQFLNEIIRQEGISGNMINDALQLLLWIDYQETAPRALQLYSQADLLLFQQKKSEALKKIEDALNQEMPADFRARLLLQAADLADDLAQYDQAIQLLNTFFQDKTLSVYADEALYRLGTIFLRRLNNPTEAFLIYDRLLSEFPNSPYANAARDRLREIREKHPDLVP
ncbi:MAG: tetratricopeptide repeat protein [Calditrichaeota bacterium]|nr:tetratricopeptide repeat protein [Calditrichota bacterium]